MSDVIFWPHVRQYLRDKLERTRDRLDVEADRDEACRLQGEARAYKSLLNLPETLALLDAEDKRAAAQKEVPSAPSTPQLRG